MRRSALNEKEENIMFQVKDVRLDYGRLRDEPRTHFVGSPAPMFSWSALSDHPNVRQGMCRITVNRAGTLLWDSGWIEQMQPELRYGGKPLPGGERLGFTLQLKDDQGRESVVYSNWFSQASVEWRAAWIGLNAEPDERPVYFRRELAIRRGLVSACLYACGIGYHQWSINGTILGNAKLDPAFTDYTRQCQYVMFPDIEALFAEGQNCLGTIVAGGWRDNPGVKKLISRNAGFHGPVEVTAMLRLRYADGAEEWICTDEAWQAGYGAYTYATVFDGTDYDAREARPGWNLPGFSGGFSAATLLDAPGGRMEPMLLEPIVEGVVRAPIAVWPDGEDAVVMDFGQNLAGVARVQLPEGLLAGKRLGIAFTEELTEDGRLFRDPLRHARAQDSYIAAGDGRDLRLWQPEFTYHGFRYARLSGLGAGFDAARLVSAVELHTDLETRSSFRCGNALVTKIHENCVETERGNMHSILTDCPQRDERMGWMNDATVRFEETPYNFDIGRIFPKLVRDLMDLQSAEGGIGCTAPFVFGNIPADPVCSSFLIAGYEAALHLGNLDLLRRAFASYEAWERCLLDHSDNYIVNYSYYGDWAGPLYACVPNENGTPGAVSAVTPGVFMSTGYSYLNCMLLAKFAAWLDIPDKQTHYANLAGKIRTAMLDRWYDADTARVATGSQACQAFALWLDILPDSDRPRAAKLLRDDLIEHDYNFTTGNLCTRYLMDVLTRFGYVEDAWKLLTKEAYPSFGYMIQQEATTVWERFELMKDASMNSHNHPMYAAVDYWMYACLLGVKPTVPGWTEFEVSPCLPKDLQSAQAVIDTARGEVAVRCIKRYGGVYLQLSVPFGCSATVRFGGKEYHVGSGFHAFPG